MKYISEIKAFYDWNEVNQLSPSSIVLWHALMHIANKTMWQDKFTVSIAVLEIKTGLKKQAIITARNDLKRYGRIDFESRKGNQSATYSIIPFEDGKQIEDDERPQNPIADDKRTQTHTQIHTQSHTQTRPQTRTQCHTINRHRQDIDKTLERENARAGEKILRECASYYEETFGIPLSGSMMRELSFRASVCDDAQLIKQALMLSHDKQNEAAYFRTVMQNWTGEGIRTYQQYCDKYASVQTAPVRTEKSSNPFMQLLREEEANGQA